MRVNVEHVGCDCNDFCTSETAQFMLTAEVAGVAAVTFDTFILQANEIQSASGA